MDSLIETLQYSRTFELAEIRNFNGLRVSQSRPEGAECGNSMMAVNSVWTRSIGRRVMALPSP